MLEGPAPERRGQSASRTAHRNRPRMTPFLFQSLGGMGYRGGRGDVGGAAGRMRDSSISCVSRENRKNISPAVLVTLRMLAWTVSL